MSVNIDEKRRLARTAFNEKKYQDALELSLEVVPYCVPEAYLTCGLIYERIKRDFERAYYYYERLRREFEDCEGYNGCVRVILATHKSESRDIAEQYCRESIAKTHSGFSYLLLGRVLQELASPPDYKGARQAYAQAAAHGAAWGLRKFAQVEYAHGSRLLGAFLHVFTTLAFPVYRLLGGKRAIRSS